ncbi:hypothetical protein B0H19DRAFT_1076482 [Mycena capillaripes]|nr:hypothetical protein B0H19DRAFT_1076482 [Mycena capillaripes]
MSPSAASEGGDRGSKSKEVEDFGNRLSKFNLQLSGDTKIDMNGSSERVGATALPEWYRKHMGTVAPEFAPDPCIRSNYLGLAIAAHSTLLTSILSCEVLTAAYLPAPLAPTKMNSKVTGVPDLLPDAKVPVPASGSPFVGVSTRTYSLDSFLGHPCFWFRGRGFA